MPLLCIFFERKRRYADETKMNLPKLLFHSLRIISVFNKKVFFFSTIYIVILCLINSFYNNILFLILILFIIIFNVVIFTISKNNKKEHLDNYLKFIENIDTISS